MLNRIFPARVDNGFRGNIVAIWLLVPITLMKTGISLLHIFSADGGAQSVSTIPLDTYPPDASQNIIAIFARMGIEQFALGLIFLIILLRYRTLIPLAYVFLLLIFFAGKAIAYMKPLALAGTSGAGTPALVIAVLSIIGLILSLTGKGYENHEQ